MSVELPYYRYQPAIYPGWGNGWPEYTLYPFRVNDALDVWGWGYNTSLLNQTAKFGSNRDAGIVGAMRGHTVESSSGPFPQTAARVSWNKAVSRKKDGTIPIYFGTEEEYLNYVSGYIASQDALTNKWEIISGFGAGYWDQLHYLYPRYEWTGGGVSGQGRPIVPNGYPRLSGLYDQNLSVNTPLIQIGYLAQKAIIWQQGFATPERLPGIILYENFTNQGSAKFKAVNENFFFDSTNPNTPSAKERENIYKNMWAQLYVNFDKYLKNMLSTSRTLDEFYDKDSRVLRQFWARRILAYIDPVLVGAEKTNPNWQYVNTRTESIDAWVYVSGSYNIATKTYTLNPNYFYLTSACPASASRDITRLPITGVNGAIYN